MPSLCYRRIDALVLYYWLVKAYVAADLQMGTNVAPHSAVLGDLHARVELQLCQSTVTLDDLELSLLLRPGRVATGFTRHP